jgi:tetratricopeptide (TPR) repeat protein
VSNWAGKPDRVIEHAANALRLSPRERIGTPLVVIGLAYFFQRRFDQALAKLLLAIQENPGSPATYRILAACYAHMGRLAEAREAATELRRITPLAMPSTLPWRMTEHRELLLSGLRLAGVEDG